MRIPDRVWRVTGDWRGDAALAGVLTVFALVFMIAQAKLNTANNVFEVCCAAVVFGSLAIRRAHPYLATIVAAVGLAATALGSFTNLPDAVGLVPVFVLAYTLGTCTLGTASGRSVLALLLLMAGLQVATGPTVFNPIVFVLTIGPWAVGLYVRSRRNLTEQLAARGRELEAERAVFAAEAVRYERARIARELHDIVAHCVSVMVIQASAGQRLTATDPASAGEAFDAIEETARQAEAEIGHLVDLLDHGKHQQDSDAIRLIGELVARAGAAGLVVSCRFTGSTDGLSAQASGVVYRVVQESLTNALKHAPGAPVEILVTGCASQVEIEVSNGPAAAPASGLERSGGGRGLAGMRERVAACGGEISLGPADGGGWRVLARLPAMPSAATVPLAADAPWRDSIR
jgi:signal transduction histidine kinase